MTEDSSVTQQGGGELAAAAPLRILGSADIQKILACLPHRYPFLLVDRIESIDSDNSGIGFKNVTFNEPHFQGHFPGNPVMPGVLIIEGMAQTAGVISILSQGGVPTSDTAPIVYFMTIDGAKFRRPVVPGDVLEYHMTKVSRRRNMWWFQGEARVGGELVAEARLGAMISGL